MLLVLAAVRQGEFRALDQPDSRLLAIEVAWIQNLDRGAPATRTALPHRGLLAQRQLTRWHARAPFELSTAPQGAAWQLYIEDLHDGGRLKVNGTVVAELPTTDASHTVRLLRPLRFDLPPGLLRAGTNVVEREWATHENMLLMPRLAVGEARHVDQAYTLRDLAYRVLPSASLVTAAVLATLMFGIYLGNREQRGYLWVAVSSAGFCVVDLIFFVQSIPAPLFLPWRLALFAGGCALTLGSYYFLLDISGHEARTYRRWTLGLSVLLCLAYLVHSLWTGRSFEPVFSRGILLLSACFAPLPLAALLRSLAHQFLWRKAVLLLVVLTGIWVNVMDFSTLNASRSAAQSGFLLQLFALVWFSSVGAYLIADFSRSLAAQRSQAAQMARELAEQREELSRLHALERDTRAAQAAALERHRIMQDMHDGLGSQLVSSLVLARAGELDSRQTCELLRSCIDDLRLAIDSSQETGDSLLLALGNLRFRMQPRLKAAGITLHWHTQALGEALPLRPQEQLAVLRVVQESLTNALKHAGAKTITFTAEQTPTTLQLRIEDDGCGFDAAAARTQATGKGLNGLEKRARLLGGQLQILSAAPGTCIVLQTPLAAPQAPPAPSTPRTPGG